MYMMCQDPSQWRGFLHCMAYVCTPHKIIQDYEFSMVSMLIDLFIYVMLFGILNLVQPYF
jgi:hypothetical protein